MKKLRAEGPRAARRPATTDRPAFRTWPRAGAGRRTASTTRCGGFAACCSSAFDERWRRGEWHERHGQGELPGDFLDLVDAYCSGLDRRRRNPPARGDLARERGGAAAFRRRISTTTPRSSSRSAPAGPPTRSWIGSPAPAGSRPGEARVRPGGCRGPGSLAGWASRRASPSCSRRSRPSGHLARIGPAGRVACRRRGHASRRQRRLADQRPGLPLGRRRTRSPAATCDPARSCGWSEGWPRSSSTGARASSSRARPASSSFRRPRLDFSTAR